MNEQELAEFENMFAELQSSPDVSFLDGNMQLLAGGMVFFQVLTVLFFLIKAWGLWNINKKLGVSHPWLSWIPVISIYMYFTAGNTSFVKYFIYPLIALIIGAILAIFTFGISIILAYLYMLFCMIYVLHRISKRTGRGAWTTVGLIFVPFIMLPVIGYKLKDQSPSSDVEAIQPTPTPMIQESTASTMDATEEL